MECSSVLQSLDTLWFFNNILTTRNVSEEKAIPQKELQDETAIKNPEFGELAAEEIVKVDKATMEEPEKEGEGEKEKEKEEEAVEMEYAPKGSESEKKEEEKRINGRRSSSSSRGKRRRRRKRAGEECMRKLFSERRMVLGEIFDMDYNDENGGRDSSSWSYNNESNIVEDREGYCGFRIGSGFSERMPPLSDDNAMKEHLKHWAHAVACTVTISVR